MIIGLHAMMYSRKAEEIRVFFRDVLELPHVDAGEGWMIFKGPPAEMAMHPTDGETHWDFSLMCDDLATTKAELASKGVEFGEDRDMGWGLATTLRLPDGADLMLYQPRYPTAI